MQNLILSIPLFISLIISTSHALTFEVVGKNQQLLLNAEIMISTPTNVGEISVKVFDTHQTPYRGGSYGFSSIFNLENVIDVISDTEMKAYGWCFSVDGVAPDTMADQTVVNNPSAKIRWFYAYAHYKRGDWISQCTVDEHVARSNKFKFFNSVDTKNHH